MDSSSGALQERGRAQYENKTPVLHKPLRAFPHRRHRPWYTRNGALLIESARPQHLGEPLPQLRKHRRERRGERGRCFCFTSHSHFPVQPSRVPQSGLETPFPNALGKRGWVTDFSSPRKHPGSPQGAERRLNCCSPGNRFQFCSRSRSGDRGGALRSSAATQPVPREAMAPG